MCAANRKAANILGWKPRVSFDEGLRRTIEWYRAFLAEFHDRDSALHRLARGDA
jgi:dTDP-D-glucose 4,6-dehydratase